MILYFINLIISSVSFVGLYFYKTGRVYPIDFYGNLLPIFVLSFIVISAYFKSDHLFFKDRTKTGLLIFIFILFIMSLFISLNRISSVSRLFIVTITASSVLIQWVLGFFWQKKQTSSFNNKSVGDIGFKLKRLFFSLLILIFSIILILFLKTGGIRYYEWSEQILLILVGAWFVSGLITNKFYVNIDQNLYYKIAPFLKSQILLLFFTVAIYFFINLDYISRELLFGSIGVFSVLEISVFLLVFATNKSKQRQYYPTQMQIDQETLLKNVNEVDGSHSIKSILYPMIQFQDKKILDFIEEKLLQIDCDINKKSTLSISTITSSNFHFYNDKSLSLIINMSPLNNLVSINEMISVITEKLKTGGIFIGQFTPLEQIYKKIRSQMPRFLFTLIYPIHFLVFRIFPKIPVLKVLYNYFTKGKNILISKAEVFGRLSYFGFEILESKILNNKIYFIAQLTKTKSLEENPSFGPLVKLKRIGLNNTTITVYKFRTMHPYSEFIQKSVYEKNSLDKSGKLKDDFRITNWGKIMRKLWIDELPQFVNWLQGDLALVGVRPLSKHYNSLYPEDLQELRTKFKPGIIPPYYADMPKNFDQILESERKYLFKKSEKPFSTDFKYFCKVFANIVFGGARSQ